MLIAADGSAFTRAAARFVVRQARELKSEPEVHVMHVHAPLPYAMAASVVGKKTVDDYHRAESLKALKVAEKELEKAGLQYTSSWSTGDAAERIARYAADKDIDVIVTGSHGHGALARLALGSVATKLIAISRVPVLIVPKR
ncbi:MAG: universal stress protein [Burkholderiales bacterium]|nr:universal stress protein [Burkholderiales bacterium]